MNNLMPRPVNTKWHLSFVVLEELLVGDPPLLVLGRPPRLGRYRCGDGVVGVGDGGRRRCVGLSGMVKGEGDFFYI